MQHDSEPSPSEWPWGAGLVLFPRRNPSRRRRRLCFVALVVAVAGMLVWPIYPRAATLKPLVLGLPFGIAWVVGCLAIVFVGLLWLYRADFHDDSRGD